MRRDADDATLGGLSDQGKPATAEVPWQYLLLAILIPGGLLVSVNAVSLYSQTLNCVRQHPCRFDAG